MAVLRGMSSAVKGMIFDLGSSETTLGRHDSNNVVLQDLSVSSFHCSIVHDAGRYTLRDLESTNGVKVNGERVTVKPLTSGNLIQVGSVELMFDDGTEAPDVQEAPGPAGRLKVVDAKVSGPAGTPDQAFKPTSGLKGKLLWVAVGIIAVIALVVVVGLVVVLARMR